MSRGFPAATNVATVVLARSTACWQVLQVFHVHLLLGARCVVTCAAGQLQEFLLCKSMSLQSLVAVTSSPLLMRMVHVFAAGGCSVAIPAWRALYALKYANLKQSSSMTRCVSA